MLFFVITCTRTRRVKFNLVVTRHQLGNTDALNNWEKYNQNFVLFSIFTLL